MLRVIPPITSTGRRRGPHISALVRRPPPASRGEPEKKA